MVTPSKLQEAQTWLSGNDDELRSTSPQGTTYLGVDAPIFSSDKYPTEVFLVYSVEEYGDLDRLDAASASRFGEPIGEWHQFLEDDPRLRMSKVLYKSLTAATICGAQMSDVSWATLDSGQHQWSLRIVRREQWIAAAMAKSA